MLKRFVLSVGAIGVLVVAGLSINWSITQSVEQSVRLDAKRKSELWSQQMISAVPGIKELIRTGIPTPDQQHYIDLVLGVGDVFRFKLFDDLARVKISSDELLGIDELIKGDHDHSGSAAQVISSGEAVIELNDGSNRPDRPHFYAEAYLPVFDVDGTVYGVVEVYSDQTDTAALFQQTTRSMAAMVSLVAVLGFGLPMLAFFAVSQRAEKSRKHAAYLAQYDQTSNVMNRQGFTSQVETVLANNEVELCRSAIIYFDVDYLKVINDAHGNSFGDAFLRHVGSALNQTLSFRDLAGRTGGGEFAILLPRNSLAEAKAFAEKLRAEVAKPMIREGRMLNGHISLGIHFDPDPKLPLAARMKKAELALRQAKIDGRNTYRVFTKDLEARLERRRAVETAILNGLSEGRFEVRYQPLISQKTKQCVGLEALLRLVDSDGGSIAPAEFIPIAEAMGTINEIGTWVLHQATQAAAEWPEELFVSVNLSPRQFDDSDVITKVQDALAASGLPASRLELEVTENLLVENAEHVGGLLTQLQQLGVSIAMDDFGTGYSSLGYLWQFGFDKLKIDRAFIRGLDAESEKTREILGTIIMLGHRLDMIVTAEGIETEGQAELLSSLACDQLQGYLFGKPMPKEDLPAFFLDQFTAQNSQTERKIRRVS